MQLSRQQGGSFATDTYTLCMGEESWWVRGIEDISATSVLFPCSSSCDHFVLGEKNRVTWWGGGFFPLDDCPMRRVSWEDWKCFKSFSFLRVGTVRGQPWRMLQLTLRRPGPRWTNLRTWRLWRKPERGGGVPGNGLNASARYQADSLESPNHSSLYALSDMSVF